MRLGPGSVRRNVVMAGAAALTMFGAIVAAGPADPVGATIDHTVVAGAAAGWLAGELAAGGGHLDHISGPDWGLTADAVIALVAAGRRDDAATRDAAAGLLSHRSDFVTWDSLGADFGGVVLAGPSAKELLVAQLTGASAADQAVLEAELRGLVVADGSQAGRVADRNPYDVDSSSTFTESLAVAALVRTPGGVPPAVTAHLLAQQCPAGGFRLTPQATPCADDAVIDTDATAIAVQAMQVVEQSATVRASLSAAVAWLSAAQAPSGSFNGTGPTAVPNTNSTALAAQALRGAGHSAAADRAAEWIAELQRPVGGADAGAVAYGPDAAAAAATAIPPLSRDQWRRSTAQAVLAFGAPVLGAIGAEAPPTTTTTVPTASTSTVPTASTTTTVAPTTTVATPTTTVATPTTTAVAPTASVTSATASTVPVAASSISGSERVDVLATTAESPNAGAGLPRTGLDPQRPVGIALICFGLGGMALVTATRFRRPVVGG